MVQFLLLLPLPWIIDPNFLTLKMEYCVNRRWPWKREEGVGMRGVVCNRAIDIADLERFTNNLD